MANNTSYGFIGLEHLFSQKIEEVNVEVVQNAVEASAEEHNRQLAEMSGDLFVTTEDFKTRFTQPGSDTLQPLDEFGNPKPTKAQGFYDVAFPIQGGGDNWGHNRVARTMSTVSDINRLMLETLRKDADWMRRHIFGAFLDNVAWTYSDVEHGDITIEPMANGDTVTYVKRSGVASTDDHYLAQANAIGDADNPFTAIYDDLREHPVNANAPIVAYVPTNLKTSIEGLADFVEVNDPDINVGISNDTLRGAIPRGFGDVVLGKVNKVWIIETGFLPDNYMVCNARGASATPLKMREYASGSLKGLFSELHSPDGNLRENRWIRYAGFGGFNRVGGLVYQIGNASYQIPTGFNTPLAV